MEYIAKWNDQLNKKFLKMMKRNENEEAIKFTAEEIEKSKERYNNFGKMGEFEKQVREERAAAATRPPVRLTF